MIIFLNHTIQNCGIYQYGKRLAKILCESTTYQISYREVDSLMTYYLICAEVPEMIIYNYHPAVFPWLNNNTIQKQVPNIGIFHESTTLVHFDYIINTDPTALNNLIQISIPRPLLPIMNKETIMGPITIGSFGFGFKNKGWDKIVKLVNEQYDEAIIKLNIPFAHFAGDDPVATTNQIKTLCHSNNVKPGIQLIITHDFLTDDQLLDFLASNTINIFMYDKMPGRGCSSVIDYALSVDRPLAISDSEMFRHIYSDQICVYKRPISDIIQSGTSYLHQLRALWSDTCLIKTVEDFIHKNRLETSISQIILKSNIILNDSVRNVLKPVINELWTLVPAMMARKIPRANIQQAFVFKYLRDQQITSKTSMICVGSYEDTCSLALHQLNYNLVDIDPRLNYDLHNYCIMTSYSQVDIIFSISMINHVKDDETFLEDICKLLKSGGLALIVCDFNNDYRPGSHKPSCDFRLYTQEDLLVRFKKILDRNNCYITGEIDYEGAPDFMYENCLYTFATLIFRKL